MNILRFNIKYLKFPVELDRGQLREHERCHFCINLQGLVAHAILYIYRESRSPNRLYLDHGIVDERLSMIGPGTPPRARRLVPAQVRHLLNVA